MEETAANERSLLERAREGDLEAFSALVELHQERVIHTAYSFLGNYEDARDAAQEAFIKAYENLGSFHGQSRFYTWLYRILMNACKDFIRKKKIRRWVSFLKDDESGGDPMETLAVTERTAAHEMADLELGQTIRQALETLPFQQRTVFTLRYFEDLSLEEIAETLKLSVGAVKAHLWQACQKMQRRLKDTRFQEE